MSAMFVTLLYYMIINRQDHTIVCSGLTSWLTTSKTRGFSIGPKMESTGETRGTCVDWIKRKRHMSGSWFVDRTQRK